MEKNLISFTNYLLIRLFENIWLCISTKIVPDLLINKSITPTVKGWNSFGLSESLTKVKIVLCFCLRSKVILHLFWLEHWRPLWDSVKQDPNYTYHREEWKKQLQPPREEWERQHSQQCNRFHLRNTHKKLLTYANHEKMIDLCSISAYRSAINPCDRSLHSFLI